MDLSNVDPKKMSTAARNGDATAQAQLGYLYLRGINVPRDYAEALNWFVKAEKQNSAFARNYLGEMFAYGLGLPQSYEDAEKWWTLAADQGCPCAQFNLVYHSDPSAHEKRLKLLKSAAFNGHERALQELAVWHKNGTIVSKNAVKAYAYMILAAEGGAFAAEWDLEKYAESMSRDQIKKGKKLAKEYASKITCKPRKYFGKVTPVSYLTDEMMKELVPMPQDFANDDLPE